MAAVYLRFAPPDRDDIVKLHILESATATSTLNEIEVVTDIGSAPNYINEYTTILAVNAADWFAIQWEDDKGALTEISDRIQGGTRTVVLDVIDRVLERSPGLAESIARHEAEATVEWYFHVDPYTVTEDELEDGRKYTILQGLTHLVLARSMIVQLVQSAQLNVDSVTLGLVTMRSGSSSSSSSSTITDKQIQDLIDLANKELGINTSVVLQLEEIVNYYGQSTANLIPYVLR